MKTSLIVLLIAASLTCHAKLPELVVPNGWGVNIHFTGAPKQDLDMIHQAGWRMIRMDFAWGDIEKQRGVYRFEAYDQLLDGLLSRGIHPIFILDYNNTLYEKESSVRTEAGRKAFASFASAAVAHYRGKPILWELWNEPNGGFWQPAPNPDEYMRLAKVVFPAIRKADPSAICVAPALAAIDLGFLEACFKRGLLPLVDAITVHPYRGGMPETVAVDYQKLRQMIARIDPSKQDIPILSGEWGYSTATANYTEQQQGEYIARQYLVNISQNVPVSIWYDWHDDGPDPNYNEHRFGTVRQDYQPKPSYTAAKKLVSALTGMKYIKRIASKPDDYLLLFGKGNTLKLAAWTTAASHSVSLHAIPSINLISSPAYITIPANALQQRAEAAWQVVKHRRYVKCGVASTSMLPEFTIKVTNPFASPQKVKARAMDTVNLTGRFQGATEAVVPPGKTVEYHWQGPSPLRQDDVEKSVNVQLQIGHMRFNHKVDFVGVNEMSLRLSLSAVDRITVVMTGVDGLSDDTKLVVFTNGSKRTLRLTGSDASDGVSITRAGKEACVTMKTPVNAYGPIRVVMLKGSQIMADSGRVRLQTIITDSDQLRSYIDGKPEVASTHSLGIAEFNFPVIGRSKALKFTYDYAQGWKFVRMVPNTPLVFTDTPSSLGVWVHGDDSKCNLNVRLVDRTGRTYQTSYGRIDFKGWRLMSCDLADFGRMAQWGGSEKHSATMALPVTVDTLLLVDGPGNAVKGELLFTCMHAVYKEQPIPGH